MAVNPYTGATLGQPAGGAPPQGNPYGQGYGQPPPVPHNPYGQPAPQHQRPQPPSPPAHAGYSGWPPPPPGSWSAPPQQAQQRPQQPPPQHQPPPQQRPPAQQSPPHRPQPSAPPAAPAAGAAEPPSRYLCPITMELMEDPVMSKSGINYERSAIQHWLQSHRHCPSTREPMTAADLFPNRALKEEIEEWRRAHQPGRPAPGGTPPARPVTPPARPAPARPPPPQSDRPWERYGISQDDFDFICALFINFDDDDGGTLDRQELTRLARWLNYPHSDRDIDHMFRTMDRDGDGALSMDEFLTYYMDKKPDPQCLYGMSQRQYNEVLMQFHSCDTDGNGELDRDEFFELCKKSGTAHSRQDSDAIFAQIDTDRGGTIDLHEFLTYMKAFR
eukprot:TRINITY_DN4904_c0_g2_i1.p1 TRINITY_DN4904_c0_g2~~TRINITY_DN4904_c0_g2_i1.p1  ORF type:complete len:424 (+),score=131.86 TRINITY_DN4904_c0_g2_i1:109-1272(+)